MAEVTGGGIPLTEMDSKTLESQQAGARGLHLCGEICDVFGRIGGFNFYWAWVRSKLQQRIFVSNSVTQHLC